MVEPGRRQGSHGGVYLACARSRSRIACWAVSASLARRSVSLRASRMAAMIDREHLPADALDAFHDFGLCGERAKQPVEVGGGNHVGLPGLDRGDARTEPWPRR